VAELGEYMIFTPLLRKHPSLFVMHFVETLVVLNGCSDHEIYKAAVAQGVSLREEGEEPYADTRGLTSVRWRSCAWSRWRAGRP
jgi:hypothetical protein